MSDSVDPEDEESEAVPVAVLIAPNGMRIQTQDFFENPREIIVGRCGVSFDGWVFRLDEDLTKSSLAWLIQQTALLGDAIGEERALAIVDAAESLYQKLNAVPPDSEEEFPSNHPRM